MINKNILIISIITLFIVIISAINGQLIPYLPSNPFNATFYYDFSDMSLDDKFGGYNLTPKSSPTSDAMPIFLTDIPNFDNRIQYSIYLNKSYLLDTNKFMGFNDSFTISYWYKPLENVSVESYQPLFSIDNDNPNNIYFYRTANVTSGTTHHSYFGVWTSGNLQKRIQGSDANQPRPIVTNEWVHFTFVKEYGNYLEEFSYSDEIVYIYINGVRLIGAPPQYLKQFAVTHGYFPNPIVLSRSLKLGGRHRFSTYFDMLQEYQFSEILFFDDALTSSEIYQLGTGRYEEYNIPNCILIYDDSDILNGSLFNLTINCIDESIIDSFDIDCNNGLNLNNNSVNYWNYNYSSSDNIYEDFTCYIEVCDRAYINGITEINNCYEDNITINLIPEIPPSCSGMYSQNITTNSKYRLDVSCESFHEQISYYNLTCNNDLDKYEIVNNKTFYYSNTINKIQDEFYCDYEVCDNYNFCLIGTFIIGTKDASLLTIYSLEEVIFLISLFFIMSFMMTISIYLRIPALVLMMGLAFMIMGVFLQLLEFDTWINFFGIVMIFWGFIMMAVSFTLSRRL